MRNSIVISIVLMVLLLAVAAEASEVAIMQGRMWNRQREGIEGVIGCYRRGAESKEYEAYVYKILSAEVNLLSYGVSPKNRNLVGGLANGLKSAADYPTFAYRLLKVQMVKKSGFEPEIQNALRGRNFQIIPRDGQVNVTVNISF